MLGAEPTLPSGLLENSFGHCSYVVDTIMCMLCIYFLIGMGQAEVESAWREGNNHILPLALPLTHHMALNKVKFYTLYKMVIKIVSLLSSLTRRSKETTYV